MNTLKNPVQTLNPFKDIIQFRVIQILTISSGMAFFAWAYFDSGFRDIEGFLDGGFCLPVSAGISLIILGCTVTGRLKRSAFWFALALVGQAVALQLINAGPFVRYQHYKSFHSLLTETNPLLLVFISAQTVLVVVGFRSLWPNIRVWLGCAFKIWQLLGIGLIFFLSSATVSREISIYVAELPFAAFIQTLNLGSVVLVVWHFPEEMIGSLKHKFDKLLKRSGKTESSAGVDRFAVIAAVWVTSIAIILNVVSYERHPHIPDEVSYLYQARYFTEGMLTMPSPPVTEGFNLDLMHYEDERWYSPFPPGWSGMLALGVFFEVPWLVNPVLAGLSVLLAYVLVREIYDRYTARIVVLLLCFSPWFVFMGMNFMAHTFTLTCALFGALAVIWARKTGKTIWGWIGGFAVGMVSLIRPLEGIIMAGLLGLWAIGVGGRRLRVFAIVGLVMGSIIVGSVVLPYNKLLTGVPTKFPVMAYFDKYYGANTNALGFGHERGVGWPIDPFPGHSPLDALVNANLNTFMVNIELFGWSTGSLILIAVMLFSGVMQRKDYLMLAVIGAVIGVHTFYWFSGGPDFGARYWYLTIVPCLALTARGIQVLTSRLEIGLFVNVDQSTRVVLGVLSLCLLAFVNFFPWRAIDKYHHYRGMRPDIRYLAKEYNFGKSLVLIRGNRHTDYASAATYNPVYLKDEASVYAWDQNREVRYQLLKKYSNYPIWIVEGPGVTGKEFRVIKGPIFPSELLTK